MDILITVISLQGQAWAVAQDGSRRELKVGDTVAGDEMVVTADGAQIDLQFANNQILTLIGEQNAPVDVAQFAEEAVLNQPLAAINTEQESLNAQLLENTVAKDGHGFVQLVRIGEILEADGFTPLTVARIQEIIKPLGMVLPERDFDDGIWKEHTSRHEHGSSREYIASINIDVIADDDIINAAEAGRDIRVTGSVGGDVKPGDKVTVTVNGKTYDTTVNPDGKTWGVDIPGNELIQDKTVQATVTGSTPTGEPITADTERPYEVDTVPPEGSLTDRADEDADKISLDLGKEFDDDVSGTELTYQAINLPEGLSIDPKTGVVSGDIDRSASQGGPDNDGKYTVTVIVTDEAGNSSEHDFVWAVTNPDPVATNDAQTIDEDTVAEGNVITGINSTGTGGGSDNDPDSDPLVVTEFTVEGNTYSAGTTVTVSGIGDLTLNENGDYTFTPLPDWNGTVPTVNYSISDGEGGTASADLDITVTPVYDLPRPVDQIDDKADIDSTTITDLNISEFFKDVDDDTLTYGAAGLPEGLSIDSVTGVISGTPNSSASQGAPNGVYEVVITATDSKGGTAEQNFKWTISNPVPDVNPDAGSTEKTIKLKVLSDEGVLENDSDEDVFTVHNITYKPESGPVTDVTPGNEIKGKYGTLVLENDGSYTYTPDLNIDAVWVLPEGETLNDTFFYTAIDVDGGISEETELVITIKGHSNKPPLVRPDDENGPSVDGHLTVYEKGLDKGTGEVDGNEHIATGEIQISALDGLKTITVGTTTLTLAQLQAISLSSPVVITDADGNGTLTLTGFDPLTSTLAGDVDKVLGGELSYTYELKKEQAHPDANNENNMQLDIDLVVTDDQDAPSVGGKLTINVVDDVPLAEPDAAAIDEDAADNTVTGNVLDNDILGADVRLDPVSEVRFGTDIGVVGTGLSGAYGQLTLNADGTYSYALDNSNPAVNALKSGQTLTEVFAYTIKDADGDPSSTTLTITINGNTDGVPTITPKEENGADDPNDILTLGHATVYESGLTTDGPDGQSKTATGEITVDAKDGLISVTVGTQTFDLAGLAALSGDNVIIKTAYGDLTLTGFIPTEIDGIVVGGALTYKYELTQPVDNAEPGQPGHENTLDEVVLKVTDAGDAEQTGSLNINIIDDAPSIGTPEDNIVHEAGLAGGSSEGVAVVAVTGDLQVRVGADSAAADGSAASVRFAEVQDQTALADLNLSSGYNAANEPIPVNYIVSADGLTLTAFKGSDQTDKVFTVTITNPGSSAAGYEFTLHKPLNHGTLESLDLPFEFSVIDGDKDPDNSSFTITVTDDAPSVLPGDSYVLNIIEDSLSTTAENTFNTSADANSTNTVITVTGSVVLDVIDDGEGGKTYSYPDTHTDPQDFYGSVTVNANGSITYVPDPNYSNPSSEDTFTYTTTNGDDVSVVPVAVHVKPVADAPDLEDDKVLETPEDTSISLALKVPLVTDNTQAEGATSTDYPERLGEITVSFSPTAGTDYGSGTGAFNDFTSDIKLLSGGNELTPDADGKFHFVIVEGVSDDWHITTGLPAEDPSSGIYHITDAQYQALTVLPPVDRHENFEVVVSVDSYEVDVNGAPLVGIDPANSTQTIKVDVQAVTDAPELTLNAPADSASVGAISLTVTDASGPDNAKITAAINEDTPLNLQSVLVEQLKDFDGSEKYWYDITGLPEGTQVTIGTKTYTADSDGKVSMPVADYFESNAVNPDPVFTLTPPKDYSNPTDAPINAVITLNSKDYDSDSTVTTNTKSVSVDLQLQVNPVADIPVVEGVTTLEDTAVNFLASVKPGDIDGSESITALTIKGIPADWTVFDHTGTDVTANVTGGELVIPATGFDLDGDGKPNYLKYSIKPPAHSSLDADLTVDMTVVDKVGSLSDSKDFNDRALKVTVTPVAEVVGVDTDDNGTPDLTMGGNHEYGTPGKEDTWFNLDTDPANSSFNLGDNWSNEDTNEETYALLTPKLIAGDGDFTDAAGSQFRYSTNGDTSESGGAWITNTFNGTDPVEVPVEYLNTLQFKAAEHFSGKFEIKVQAKTVDYDDDHPGDLSKADIAISGESTLTNILILPVADEVTLAVNGLSKGFEDLPIALSIRPSSSDPKEIFDIRISGIPVGAQLLYDGNPVSFDATGVATIEGFDPTKPLTIQAPENNNENFALEIEARSVDTLVIPGESASDPDTEYTEKSDWSAAKTITVQVKGVADAAILDSVTDLELTEESVDNDSGEVALSQLITSASLTDTDGSEALTLKVTLADGFSLNGGVPLGNNTWLLNQSDLSTAKIQVPEHYSGNVEVKVSLITTENDGDTLEGAEQGLSFVITPSPEGNMTSTTDLLEDTLSKVAFAIESPDPKESLTAVWINSADVDGNADFTLYLGADKATTLAQAAGQVESGVEVDGGWYKLTGNAIDAIHAQGAPNNSGTYDFQVRYEISNASVDGTVPAVATQTGPLDYSLAIAPVTDSATLEITAITSSIAANAQVTGNDVVHADGNTVLDVNLRLTKDQDSNANDERDYDGSEKLTGLIIDGVPQGVTVVGAQYIGNIPNAADTVNTGRWLMDKDVTLNAAHDFTVQFDLGGTAATMADINATVSIQAITQDGSAALHSANTSWALTTPESADDFDDNNAQTAIPADIVKWEDNPDFVANEDEPFTLAQAITAEITGNSAFAVTVTGFPVGTELSGAGVSQTLVNGVPVWTVSGSGSDAQLQNLLSGINVKLPQDWNDNSHTDELTLKATLTTHAPNGDRKVETVDVVQPVTPVSDPAIIDIAASNVTEGDAVVFDVTVSNPVDDPVSVKGDGALYLKVTEGGGLAGGSLSYNGAELTPQSITGVAGIPDGDYYVVPSPDVALDTPLQVIYKGGEFASGSVELNAWVATQETDAVNIATGTGSGSALVKPVNSGFGFDPVNDVTATGDEDTLIQIPVTGALLDADGSEEIIAVLLKNLPDGFLLFTGSDEASATLAGNAGSNTWSIPTVGGQLPAYIAVKPPLYWSGNLTGISLVAMTKESALDVVEETTIDINLDVAPVANGIEIAPTLTFGSELDIVPINLNAAMPDQDMDSPELATLTFKGLGEHAAFYAGSDLLEGKFTYDSATDTYTLIGLTSLEVDNLGFKQAAGVIEWPVTVTAKTIDGAVESGLVSGSFDVNSTADLATNSANNWLYAGAGAPVLDGLGGVDTVQLRFNESVSGTELAGNLKNIEVIDMSGEGSGKNEIGTLSVEDVFKMTDDANVLKILGDNEDSISLDGWGSGVRNDDTGTTLYTGTYLSEEVKLEVSNLIID